MNIISFNTKRPLNLRFEKHTINQSINESIKNMREDHHGSCLSRRTTRKPNASSLVAMNTLKIGENEDHNRCAKLI